MFQNRSDAGKQLAERLRQYKGANAVVLALPRGGVVVGYEVARLLGLPLDIVAARKIGHPQHPEYAICATDEKGTLLCNEAEAELVDQDWLSGEIEQQKKEVARRIKVYRGGKKSTQVTNKVAIIVDDGIATGLTMRLAIKAVKEQKPDRIIIAVPVAPSDTVREIRREADEIIVLEPPKDFMGAIGAHYQEFEQVEDEEVIRLLQSAYGAGN